MKISLVLPVRNAAKDLALCLDAVLDQTMPELEVLCVECGSADGSDGILAAYEAKDSRVRRIAAAGADQGTAWNMGARQAEGGALLFWRADLRMEQGFLAHVAEKMTRTQADIMLLDETVFVAETGEKSKALAMPFAFRKMPDVFSREDVSGNILVQQPHNAWRYVYRTDFYRSAQVEFPALPYGEAIPVTCLLLLLAERITAAEACPVQVWKRIADKPGEVRRKAPLAVPQALRSLRGQLEARGLLEAQAGAFAGAAVQALDGAMDIMPTLDARMELARCIASEELESWALFDREAAQYQSAAQRDKVRGFRQLPALSQRMQAVLHQDGITQTGQAAEEDPDAPMFSIVIPGYNSAKYLGDCLDSVLAQTCQDFEVICVDDGSTDGTAAVMQSYCDRDPRFRLIRQENGGASVARNTGLSQARGRYIAFLDSDDWIVADHLQKVRDRILRDDLDLVFFRGQVVVSEEDAAEPGIAEIREKEEVYFRLNGSYPEEHYTGPELFRLLFENKDYNVAPTVAVVRRSLLMQSGIRFLPGIVHEDNDYTFRVMMLAGKAALMPDKLLCRRLRPGSVMTSPKTFWYLFSTFVLWMRLRKMEMFFGTPILRFGPAEETGHFPQLTELQAAAVMNEENKMLRTARNYFRTLPPEEKIGFFALPEEWMVIFRDQVEKPVGKVDRINQLKKQLKKGRKKESSLRRKIRALNREKAELARAAEEAAAAAPKEPERTGFRLFRRR